MLNDLRYAWRMLTRSPGFSALAIVTLALGIGVNTAMFGIIRGVLLKPLPFRDPERLVRFIEGRPDYQLNVSYPNFLDWRARARSFEEMAIFNPTGGRAIVAEGGVSEAVPSGTAEARLFTMLGMRPVRGRLFTPEEETRGGPGALLISHRLWQRRFGGADAVLARTIAGLPIVGVLPPDFRVQNIDVWYPLGAAVGPMQLDRGNHPGFHAYARLREGVGLAQAQREMSAVAADLERQYPQTNHRMGVIVRPLLETVVGAARPMLKLLAGAVAVLLLIACANLANVLLARGLRRERETAVRAALGAGRLRLARLFITESVVMSAAGGGLAVLVAAWSVRALHAFPRLALPRSADISIDVPVILCAVGLSMLAGVLCGLAPALQLSRVDLLAGLKTGSAGTTAPTGRGVRSVLIGAEVALSLMLLVGAALMIRTIAQLSSVDPGYRAEGLLAINVHQSRGRFGNPAVALPFMERLLADLAATPGVASVAAAWPLDLVSFGWTPYVNIPDKPFPRGQEPPVQMASVTPSFFATMGIPLRRGRLFGPQDRPGARTAVIVNETFVRRLLPAGDPIGRRVAAVGIPALADAEIVGVVGDTRRGGLAGRLVPEMYCAYPQFPEAGPTIVVRAAVGDPLDLTAVLQERISKLDAQVAPYGPRRISDALSDTVGDRRLLSILLSVFAALALALTAVGIGGVTAFVVAQRTWEIGVRMALGADAGSVIRTMLGGLRAPLAAGLAFGMAGTVAFAGMLQRFLFQITPADPLAIAGGALTLILAALAAAYIPARRATRIDPLTALRE